MRLPEKEVKKRKRKKALKDHMAYLRISKDLKKCADKKARQQGLKFSAWVRSLIEKALDG